MQSSHLTYKPPSCESITVWELSPNWSSASLRVRNLFKACTRKGLILHPNACSYNGGSQFFLFPHLLISMALTLAIFTAGVYCSRSRKDVWIFESLSSSMSFTWMREFPVPISCQVNINQQSSFTFLSRKTIGSSTKQNCRNLLIVELNGCKVLVLFLGFFFPFPLD